MKNDLKQAILSHFSGNYESFYQKYLPSESLKSLKRERDNEVKCLCCFHADSHPSLSLDYATGKWHCFGEKTGGDIFSFYGRRCGLSTRTDFREILNSIAYDFSINGQAKKSSPIKIVKIYDYVNVAGELVFQVLRFEPKDFRQRRPDGKGGWIPNLKGVELVPYHLPEVLKTDEIIITEGEKNSDTLAKLGFTASTNSGGAKKWRPEYNKYFQGKHVVLIPDNDPPGREHMALVGASLNGTTASLKLLELPGLPEKGDVSDWIATFSDKTEAAEKLAMMIENCKPYTPPKKATIEDVILNVSEFEALDLPEKQILLHPWLTEQAIILISGWRGTGKTWTALGILNAITKGESFGPWRSETSVPCLFLDGEMPPQDIKERIQELDSGQERLNPLYIYSDAYANSLGLPRAHLASEKWRTSMKQILLTKKVKLWVVDNLASLANGLDENSKKDWDPINSWLLELRFAGISTVLLHHTNKEGGQRGTSAREDNIDISISLRSPHDYSPEDGARFVLHFTKARIRTKDLPLIGDLEFKLAHDPKGKLIWIWNNVKGEIKKETLRLLDSGMTQADTANTLGIDKGYVSRIRKQAIRDGILNSKNKIIG